MSESRVIPITMAEIRSPVLFRFWMERHHVKTVPPPEAVIPTPEGLGTFVVQVGGESK